jgi:spore germination protein YaaH
MSSSNGTYGQKLSHLWRTGFTLLAALVSIDAQSMSEKDAAQGRPTVYAWFPARFGTWKTAWYCYRDGDAFVQGWFNDAKAWTAKLRWVKEQDLGGIGIWVLDGTNDSPERWQVLRAAFGERLGETRRP